MEILISKIRLVPNIFKLFAIFLLVLIPTTIFWLRIIAVVETFRELEEFYIIELPTRPLITWSMMAIMTTIITTVFFVAFLREMFFQRKGEDSEKTKIFKRPELLPSSTPTEPKTFDSAEIPQNQEDELKELEKIQAKRKRLMNSMNKIAEGEDLDSEEVEFIEGLEEEFKDEPEIEGEPEDFKLSEIDSEIERLKNLSRLEKGIQNMKVPIEREKPFAFLKNLKIFQRNKTNKKKDFNPRAMPL